MARILPDGTIQLNDGRVIMPCEAAPKDAVHDLTNYPKNWSSAIREIAERCREALMPRRIGMVGKVYSPGPRSGSWWFSVRSDLYSQADVTVLAQLKADFPFTEFTLSVLAWKEPEHCLAYRQSSLATREIDRMLAEVDLETIEEPLARAVRLRLPAASPKHWLPAGRDR